MNIGFIIDINKKTTKATIMPLLFIVKYFETIASDFYPKLQFCNP